MNTWEWVAWVVILVAMVLVSGVGKTVVYIVRGRFRMRRVERDARRAAVDYRAGRKPRPIRFRD